MISLPFLLSLLVGCVLVPCLRDALLSGGGALKRGGLVAVQDPHLPILARFGAQQASSSSSSDAHFSRVRAQMLSELAEPKREQDRKSISRLAPLPPPTPRRREEGGGLTQAPGGTA